MQVNALVSKRISVDPANVEVTSIYASLGMGEVREMETDSNKNIDSKDLKMLEQNLTSKIDVSEARLSGKIDTIEAKLTGRMDVVDTKLSSLDSKIATQTKRMDWLIALVIGSILVPVFIKLFIK